MSVRSDDYPAWQEGYNLGWSNAIQECARVAEKGNTWDCRNIAAAIRALKDKGEQMKKRRQPMPDGDEDDKAGDQGDATPFGCIRTLL